MSAFELFATVMRAVALGSIVVMTGALMFRWGVLERWPASSPAPLAEWNELVARAGAWAAACVLVVSPARLYAQARGLVMDGDPVIPMMENVLHTMWGRGWLLQAGAAIAMLTALLFARRGSRGGWWLGILSATAITLSPALMGHAVAAERLFLVSVFSDWIHVAMAGAWLGALSMVALVARSRSDAAGAHVATLIELFHPVALTCAMTLVTTGVISLLLRVEHLADLPHSAYGAILAAKLALTFGIAMFGLHHARRGARLSRAGGTSGVVRSLAAETVLAALVIATTAVLVGTAPPMSMTG
ncbi:MAG TPA: CopD family protein [Gemmatimonadaceae bacterium]|nr:CopD family protein [Gemmatimonadaceae bacterium]